VKAATRATSRTWLIWLLVLIIFTFAVRAVWATEAPGCANQHWRPRETQCCPRYEVGDTLPPKCGKWLRNGTLEACCLPRATITPVVQPTPQATSTVDVCTVWPDWEGCQPTPTEVCDVPTPLPTPESHLKGQCCKEALAIYRAAKRVASQAYRAEVRAINARRQAQMHECREGY
jgi:hypothetical protein